MGVPEHEVAVVTPYQAQVSLISEMIREDHPTMTIGSVDGLQGQEREVGLFGNCTCRILTVGNHPQSGPIKYIRRSRFPWRVQTTQCSHDQSEKATCETSMFYSL